MGAKRSCCWEEMNIGWFRFRNADDEDRAKTAKFNPDQLTKQTNILWSYTGGALRMELSPKGENMSGHGSKKKLDGSARPIKTKRDFAGAQIVVKKIGDQTEPETAAEARMQSLVKAMEKFDSDEDESGDELGEDGYAGPRRRWSDDATDTDLD